MFKAYAFISQYRTNKIDRASYTSSKELNKFENLLHEIGSFILINKNIIATLNYIKSYTKG